MSHTPVSSTATPPRGGKVDGQPNPIDVYVGARMRHRRILLGLSQSDLGSALGVTFQQIQKYERGANRIGASRLYDLGKALGVSVAHFFADMDEETEQSSPGAIAHGVDPLSLPSLDFLRDRGLIDLARDYKALSAQQQRTIRNLVHTMGPLSAPKDPGVKSASGREG